MSKWWSVKPHGNNNYLMTRDVTWADIKACVNHLSLNAELHGGEGDEFAPLHRVEGGFMCVAGLDFRSNEPVDSKLTNPSFDNAGDASVRNIRFVGEVSPHWPSRNGSFLDTPGLRDDTVVMPMGKFGTFSLQFSGENSKAWTPWQCEEFGSIIAENLNCSAIHGNLAAKIKNGALNGIVKRKRRVRGRSTTSPGLH